MYTVRANTAICKDGAKVNLNNLVDDEIYFPNCKILLDKVVEIQHELIKQKGKGNV